MRGTVPEVRAVLYFSGALSGMSRASWVALCVQMVRDGSIGVGAAAAAAAV